MSEDGAATGSTTYVVQMARELETNVDADGESDRVSAWVDIATVTVPRKSPRKRVIAEALRQSGIRPALNMALMVRVLDEASSSEAEVVAYQPEALWRVS